MILRRVRYLVTLLLVLSAFAATTAQSNIFTPAGPIIQPVNATFTIIVTLSPGTGQIGTHVAVNSTNALPSTDTSCSISTISADQNGHSPIDPGTAACIVNGSSLKAEGSFTIGNVLPGQYVIEVTSCPGNNGCTPSQTPPGDYGQALLNVVSGPSIALSPATGVPGAHVLVNGTGFLPTDTTCALGAPGTNAILPGAQACAIVVGTGIANASFTIGNVSPGQYVIMLTGYAGGDSAQAVLNVVSGPSIKLSPATGVPGAHVLVNGTGFLPTDTYCALGAPGTNAILPGTQACVISHGSGIANASFTINNVLPGQYVIMLTAYPGGDSAQALLNVVSGPSIKLSPATGAPGGHILVNGTGFLPTDTYCALGAPGSNAILAGTQACATHVGSGVMNGSFTIGNVLPGQYVIMLTGYAGGDSAQAVLNVVSGPKIGLTPGSVRTGAHILVNGTGFLPTDTSCSVSGPNGPTGSGTTTVPSEVIVPGTAGCVIRAGTGVVNGSFIISNVQPGQYVIEITACGGNNGCAPSVGDFAQAVLFVVSGPSLYITPGSVRTGAHVAVNGTGFLPSDTSCVLVSGSSNLIDPILAGTAACVIAEGSGLVNASFTVGNVPPGQYVIEVDASTPFISTVTTTISTSTVYTTATTATTTSYTSTTNVLIDTAQALLNVVGGPSIRVYPVACGATGATGGCEAGAHIMVNGTGFLPTDTYCSLGAPGSNVIEAGTQACATVVGSGIVNASFTIGNVLPGQYVIMITGYAGGDSAQAIVNVVSGPSIRVYPVACGATGATGGCEAGAHIMVNGTGFLPTDTYCSLGAPGSNAILPGTQACAIEVGSGIVNASFTIGNVLPGQYVIMITGYAGGDSAQAIVNVVSGPSIRVYPTVCGSTGVLGGCEAGAHIFVNGTGFLPTDTSCSLGAPGSNAILPGTQACAIEVGTGITNASFTIGNVLPGQYVIQITGYAGGDSAQAIVNVVSGPSIRVYPVACGATGATGGCEAGAHIFVNGTGFLPTDKSCSLGAPGNNVIEAGTQACAMTVGSGVVNASFTIGNVLPGQYLIQITGYAGGDSAQAIVNVVSGPSIRVYPTVCGSTGVLGGCEAGAHIFVNGTGFLPTDQSCSLSSLGVNVILSGTQGCVIEVGTGVVNASFTIGSVSPGQYVIEITGCVGNNGCSPSAGDFAQAIVNVVSGPSIRVYPTVCGSTGVLGGCEAGAHIFVNGSGFLPTDTSCSLGAPGSNAIESGTQACAIVVGSGVTNASFTIGNVLPGQYVIQITSYPGGDSAQAIVNVVSGPSIRVYPVACGATGTTGGCEAGAHIFVNGTGFLPTDKSCALGAPGNNVIEAGTQACAIEVGTGITNASFTIGNVLPGQYLIQITGYAGGDSAQAIVNVVSGPSIRVYPVACSSSGAGCDPGIHIFINGTGFLPTDTTCSIGAPGSNAIDPGTQACVIEVGTGVVNASFTIGNVVPGQYVIQITGYAGADSAQAILNVNNSGPRLSLTPATGIIGQEILVNGTGFLPTDQSCSISGIGNGNVFNPVLVGSAGCAIAVGTGMANASFIIGNVSPGQYVIEITGCLGNAGCAPSVGDFAQQVLRVNPISSPLVLFPANATNGATVTFSADGLSPSDTSCTVLAYNYQKTFDPTVTLTNGLPPASLLDNNLITSPTCSIVTPTIAQGTFVVGPYATENVPWNVTVRGSPVNDYGGFAVANVTASIVVVPTSGTINSVFTYTGSGFESTATSCTATLVPFITGLTAATEPSCALSANTGQVSGSFLVPSNAIAGTYGIVVGDNTGSNATGIFTVGTPSALVVLNPSTVEQGQSVGLAGTGFNPQDAYCTISSASGNALFDLTHPVTCLIASGYASGSFDVSPNAPGGYYLITVTGCSMTPTAQTTTSPPTCPSGDSLDFASNFLGVVLATTVTTYSTTTSTSSTTTSLSTTTTSVATSFSYSSTTIQTTGILYTTYSHFTVSTVSGLTTTAYSQTSLITQTQTTVTYSTTTQFTTVPCGPLPCGFSTQPVPFNPAPGIDSAGLLASLLLLIPMLLRRLFT